MSGHAREEDAASVHGYTSTLWQTVREQVVRSGRSMRRVCAGTPVHYEQAVRSLTDKRVFQVRAVQVEPMKPLLEPPAKLSVETQR